MPRIPVIPTYEGRVTVERAGAPNVQSYAPFVIGRGGETVGGVLQRRAEQLLQEYDRTRAYEAFNDLRNESREKLTELLQREGRSALGAQKDYDDFYRKNSNRIAKDLDSTYQASMFRNLSDQHRQGDLNALAAHEAREHRKYKGEVITGLGAVMNREMAIMAFDDEGMNNRIQEYFDAVDGMFPGHDNTTDKLKSLAVFRTTAMEELISKDTDRALVKLEEWKSDLGDNYYTLKERLKQEVDNNKLETAYALLIEKYGNNLHGAYAAVMNPKSAKTLGLDFDQQTKMAGRISTLISKRQADEDRVYTIQSRIQDQTEAQVLADLSDPATRSYAFAQLPELVKTQQIRTAFYRTVTRDEDRDDDLTAVADITERIARNEDVSSIAVQYAADGRLKNSTASGFLKANADDRIKEGLGYINTALAPGELQYAPDRQFRLAEARDLFFTSIRAEEGDPVLVARRIVQSYRDGARRSIKGLRRPITMPPGTDKTDLTALQEARMVLLEQHDAGQISTEVYKQEAENIEELINKLEELQSMESAVEESEQVRKQYQKSIKEMAR